MADLSPEAQAQLAKLATDLANNPKTRKGFTKLVREIDPSKRFPDVETDEIREEMRKEFETRDADRKKEAALAKIEAQKNGLKSRYDDKAIGEIEALMEKLGISDYDIAARLYASEIAAATPRSGEYVEDDHKWSLPKFDVKDIPNLTQNARANAYKALDEVRRKAS